MFSRRIYSSFIYEKRSVDITQIELSRLDFGIMYDPLIVLILSAKIWVSVNLLFVQSKFKIRLNGATMRLASKSGIRKTLPPFSLNYTSISALISLHTIW